MVVSPGIGTRCTLWAIPILFGRVDIAASRAGGILGSIRLNLCDWCAVHRSVGRLVWSFMSQSDVYSLHQPSFLPRRVCETIDWHYTKYRLHAQRDFGRLCLILQQGKERVYGAN